MMYKEIVNRILAGIAISVVAFPLSIGFAVIAGVPAEVMITASIFAAFFNAFFAKSRYGIGGPNTAVALITGAAVAPFAPREGDLYLGYVLALTVMVGVIQLVFSAILRKIDIMDYVSNTVINGLTMGIGAIFVLSSINMAAGLAADVPNQWIILNAFSSFVLMSEGDANYFAILTAVITIVTGIICWQIKFLKSFAILIAVVVGFVAGNILDGLYNARLELVGWLDLNLLATSLPDFRQVSWPVLIQMSGAAAAIAIIGTLQTLSIAKAIREPGDEYNPSRETFSQGFQHIFMGFFYGCPSSNSFNKSTLAHDLKADKWSMIVSAIFTLILVTAFTAIVAAIPMAALGGCLVLVGLSMMNPFKYTQFFKAGKLQLFIFLVSALSVVVLSIQSAIFIGALASIALHFMKIAKLHIDLKKEDENTLVLKLSGAFFFVTGAKLNKRIQAAFEKEYSSSINKVFVDLRDAMIMTSEYIDVDWLHNILGKDIPITIVCLENQQTEIQHLVERGGLPDGCEVKYQRSLENLLHRRGSPHYGRRKGDLAFDA